MVGRKQLLYAVVGAIAFLGGVAPSKAHASCGDYVMPEGQGHGQSSTPQTRSEPFQSQQSPVQPSPGKPCRGPFCSNHQELPPAPPAPPVPTTQKIFLGSLDLIQLDDGQARLFIAESRCRLSQGAALDVFHPPRPI